jgi:hypothetical protein
MVKYFAECQTKGRARLIKDDTVEGNVNNVLPVWGPAGVPPREDQRRSTGKSSVNLHRKGVDLLNKKYCFQWDLQAVPSQIQIEGASDMPEASAEDLAHCVGTRRGCICLGNVTLACFV